MITGVAMVRKTPPDLVNSKRFQEAHARVLASGKDFDWSKLAPLEKSIRAALAVEFDHRCAYCGSRVGGTSTVELDRYYPRNKYPQKSLEWENLLPACSICNAAKGTRFPLDGDGAPLLFHPREDNPDTHFAEDSDGRWRGLTSKGTTTIELLQLNRPPLVAWRCEERRRLDAQLRLTVTTIEDIAHRDIGLAHDGEVLGELAWLLFLKVLDDRARKSETLGIPSAYSKTVRKRFQWRTWATASKELTGDALHTFVAQDLFPALQNLSATGEYAEFAAWVRKVFTAAQTKLSSGDLLRQIIDLLDDVDFSQQRTLDLFGKLYEDLLGSYAGPFSDAHITPRSLVQFMVEMLDPKPGETVLDPAMGSGGFLVSTLEHMRQGVNHLHESHTHELFGYEINATTYFLAVVNLMLHGLEFPRGIESVNALTRYRQTREVDVIVTNPPFGSFGSVRGLPKNEVLANWPEAFKTRDNVSLFVLLTIETLKSGGRASLIVPNGFLFSDGISARIREKLLEDCNLHTIVRLDDGLRSTRSQVNLSILFFEKGSATRDIWYYEHPSTVGKSGQSSTLPTVAEGFAGERAWWHNRKTNNSAWKVSIEEIRAGGNNLDLRHPRHERMTNAFRIEWLKLHSFRGFGTLTLELPKQGPAVLIGINGAGKSTILEAMAMHLSHFATLLRGESTRQTELHLRETDIKQGDKQAKSSVLVQLGEEKRVWDLQTPLARNRSSASNRKAISEQADALLENLTRFKDASVPVFCFYPATRGLAEPTSTVKRSSYSFSQLGAYERAFSRDLGPFQDFVQWFRDAEDTENERRLRLDPDFRDRQLEVVRRAVQDFLSVLDSATYANLRMERFDMSAGTKKTADLVLDKAGVHLSIGQLSEGERNTLLMVADLARRLAVANPKREDPLRGEGVILIDEIDLHLHPAWQRELLPALIKTFPECQFIASTHSPQVLGRVPKDGVFIIENFEIVKNRPHTYGRDANSILGEVMGVSERPKDITEMIRNTSILLDEERIDEAKRALRELAELIGDDDKMVFRLRTLASLLEDDPD